MRQLVEARLLPVSPVPIEPKNTLFRLDLPGIEESVPFARATLTNAFTFFDRLSPYHPQKETILVVASEGVTNAVRYAFPQEDQPSSFTLDVREGKLPNKPGKNALAICIWDPMIGFVEQRSDPYAIDEEGGNGFRLMSTLSDDIGMEIGHNKPGKGVWVVFERGTTLS